MIPQDMQNSVLKKMSPQQKLEASMRLYYAAQELKAAWLGQLHSDWSPQKIRQAVREIFANAG